jgi:hydrogenase/urease accessory protein HupE
MNARVTRTVLGAVALLGAVPSSAAAHAGHAGDHGWLFGALQPLLSWDHALAGLVVAGVGTVVVMAVAAWRRERRGERRVG